MDVPEEREGDYVAESLFTSAFRLPRKLRYGLLSIGVFSLALNIIQISLPIYSMQVFDRVLASGSTATLIALTAIVGLLLSSGAVLDALRAQMCVRLGNILELHWRDSLLKVAFHAPQPRAPGQASLRDLESLKSCVMGPAMTALMDLPWSSLYLLAIFALAPVLGWLALGAAALLLTLAAVGGSLSVRWSDDGHARAGDAQRVLEASLAGRDAVLSMGAEASVQRRIAGLRDRAAVSSSRSLDRSAWFGAAARGLRSLMQVIILMTAALLVLSEEIPAGIIVASSMLFTRALTPIERVIASHRTLWVAWAAFSRLLRLEPTLSTEGSRPLSLPSLTGQVDCIGVSGRRSAVAATALDNISFSLSAGQVLVLVGSSGSGKSTLARFLVGALRPTSGTIRLDGAAIGDWNAQELGRQIGFLSQEPQLLDGTVAEVIARFGAIDDSKVVAAAHRAGAHELILALPKGYQTVIGRSANALSAGERQRIALARAFYDEPALLVLDEPTANLDDKGEKHILQTINSAKDRGATTVIVTRLSSILHIADYYLMLEKGRMRFFSPRKDLSRFLKPRLASNHDLLQQTAVWSSTGR